MGILQGRVAIVTGASSGIGRAIALRFAGEGARVAVADITEQPKEGGAPTVSAIAAGGGEAFFLRTDVARWVDVDRLVAEVVRRYDTLDIMVNNAATYVSKRLTETNEAEWEAVIGVNL